MAVSNFFSTSYHQEIMKLRMKGRRLLDETDEGMLQGLIDGTVNFIGKEDYPEIQIVFQKGSLIAVDINSGKKAWMCRGKGCTQLPAEGKLECPEDIKLIETETLSIVGDPKPGTSSESSSFVFKLAVKKNNDKKGSPVINMVTKGFAGPQKKAGFRLQLPISKPTTAPPQKKKTEGTAKTVPKTQKPTTVTDPAKDRTEIKVPEKTRIMEPLYAGLGEESSDEQRSPGNLIMSDLD